MALFFLVLSATACPSPRPRSPGPPQSRPDGGPGGGSPVATSTPADVLFVVDNSVSMAAAQERLAAAFPSFLDAVEADLQVMVVSTDLSSAGGEQEGSATLEFASEPPNVLVGADVADCQAIQPMVGHGCARGPDPASRILASSQLTRAEMIARFQANARLGTCGAGDEQGISAATAALGQRDGCNAGFFREEANLIVIFVSDEEDAGSGLVASSLATLTAVKPPAKLRLGGILGAVDGEPSNCGVGIGASCGTACDQPPPLGSGIACAFGDACPSGEFCDVQEARCTNEQLRYWDQCFWCSFYAAPDCCSAIAGERYVQLLRTFEFQVSGAQTDCRDSTLCHLDSICQESLDAAMARLARRLVGGVL